MRDTRPRRPTGASNFAVFLDSQNWSPVDVSDLVVLLDLFPKVGKTKRTVGHSFTCTSDLYRRRVRLSRLCLSAGRAVPGLTALGPAGPDRTWPCGRAGPGRAVPGRAGPGRAAPGSYRRPGGFRNASGGKASAHTTGPGFGVRPAAGLRNATRLRRTRPGQVSARRLLNWSPVDGSDFVVVFLDFSNYHPVKVAKCLVTSSS